MPRPLLIALALACLGTNAATATSRIEPTPASTLPTAPPPPPLVRVFTEYPLDAPVDPVAKAVLTPMAYWAGAPWTFAKVNVDALASYLASLPPGYRAADLNWVAAGMLRWDQNIHNFNHKPDPVRTAEAGAIDLSFDARRLRPLALALERRGITLDFIFTDIEDGIGYWHLNGDQRAALLRSDAAKRTMPESIRALDAEPKWGSPEWRRAVRDWCHWAEGLRTPAIRAMLTDSGLLKPGAHTVAVNYWNFTPSFPVYDYNGWPQDYPNTIDGRTSCPVLYLTEGNFRPDWPELKKARAWNALIEDLNKVRSCAATGPVVPVLAGPPEGVAGRWVHDQLIGHALRSGVTTMVFWNQADAAGERDFAHAVLRHQRAARADRPNPPLPEIPLDADTITTGDLTTRYADFARLVPPPAPPTTTPPAAAPPPPTQP